MKTHKGIGLLHAAANHRRNIVAEASHPDAAWRRSVRLRRAYRDLADSVSARMGLPLSWQRGRPDGNIDEDREFLRAAFDLPAPVLP